MDNLIFRKSHNQLSHPTKHPPSRLSDTRYNLQIFKPLNHRKSRSAWGWLYQQVLASIIILSSIQFTFSPRTIFYLQINEHSRFHHDYKPAYAVVSSCDLSELSNDAICLGQGIKRRVQFMLDQCGVHLCLRNALACCLLLFATCFRVNPPVLSGGLRS